MKIKIIHHSLGLCLPLAFLLACSVTPAIASETTALSDSSATTVPRSASVDEPLRISGTPTIPPADKRHFEIFLLMGQSNMAGRAPLTQADSIADPRVLVLNRLDQWYHQGDPLHYDKPKAVGVGPGFAFAKLLAARKPGVTIGLVPCAYGGTSMRQWEPESKDLLYPPDNLYNNAIRRAKKAMESGTLAGILWHQGESDAGNGAGTYAAQLAKLAALFRKDLGAPNVPFIAGEIGYFNYAERPFAQTVNQQIDMLPALVPKTAVASADGLKDKGDHLHFDNESQKELANRFLKAFMEAQGQPDR